jgi:peptide deformylase
MNLVQTAVRKVVRLGHPVLRAKARVLTAKEIVSPEIQRLLEEMAASMEEYEGVGIAANQVGQGLSIFLMGLAKGGPRHEKGIPLTVVCNPKVRYAGKPTEVDWEGCLSVPGLRGRVPRYKRLELSGLDHKGQPFKRAFEDFPARVVQHETDHLNGLVYLDRMSDLKTLAYNDR